MARCLVASSSSSSSPPTATCTLPLFTSTLHILPPPPVSILQQEDGAAQLSPSSPSFNDSFASSMSLSASDPTTRLEEPTRIEQYQPQLVISSPPSLDCMDFSPAPLPRQSRSDGQVPTLRPPPPPVERSLSDSLIVGPEYPFLSKLLREKQKGAVSPPKRPSPPRASGSRPRAPIPSAWNDARHTMPVGSSSSVLQLPGPDPVKRLSEPMLPSLRASGDSSSSPYKMDIDGASPQPPAFAATMPGKRSSAGLFLSRPQNHPRSVSDTRDARRSSPASDGSGASDRLGDLFLADLSPIHPSRTRKRGLDHVHSPSSTDALALGDASSERLVLDRGSILDETESSPPRPPPPMLTRRPLLKAVSTNNLWQARRRGSNAALGSLNKRPALSSVLAQAQAPVVSEQKRHAETLHGKPCTTKSVRRAYSVVDATVEPLQPLSSTSVRVNGGGSSGPVRPHSATVGKEFGSGVLKRHQTDYFSTVGHLGKVVSPGSLDVAMAVDGSPVGSSAADKVGSSPLTGFRNQEEKGKALPCFPVKEDGLMRINAETLDMLQSGAFADEVASHTIIDCRFSYEYEGGHIIDAVNMPTTDLVEQAFFGLPTLPTPCTSEKRISGGKNVIIFHCEFSAKRAPTSATHLRHRDRTLNSGVYPNVCYPEIYVLAGGYKEYFEKFPQRCSGGYRHMDDPSHLSKRAVDLHAFRRQARPFARASSFTFGESHSASSMLKMAAAGAPLAAITRDGAKPPSKLGSLAPANFIFPAAKGSKTTCSITEEEHDGDSSFSSNNPGSSPCGPGAAEGDSPCPTTKVGRHSLKLGKELTERRPFARAQTSSAALFGLSRRK